MKQYLDLLEDIMVNGIDKSDRTGVGTRSVFGRQMRFNLKGGFPLLTTKELNMNSIIHELLWFISGNTNVKYLNDNGVHIWDDWADENGELGPIYGKQWRDYGGVDQLKQVIREITSNPNSRRLIVDSWNVNEIDNMALPPCHCLFQFYVADNKLSCHMYQRSADVFLGVPFNIASYALLTIMIAHVCDLELGDFIHSFGDVHIYSNHFNQVRKQLKRYPGSLPEIMLNPSIEHIDKFTERDIDLIGYYPDPHISAPIAV